MAQVTNFFVGANSGEGFRNLFSEMVDIEDVRANIASIERELKEVQAQMDVYLKELGL